jgi:hypothetical protein
LHTKIGSPTAIWANKVGVLWWTYTILCISLHHHTVYVCVCVWREMWWRDFQRFLSPWRCCLNIFVFLCHTSCLPSIHWISQLHTHTHISSPANPRVVIVENWWAHRFNVSVLQFYVYIHISCFLYHTYVIPHRHALHMRYLLFPTTYYGLSYIHHHSHKRAQLKWSDTHKHTSIYSSTHTHIHIYTHIRLFLGKFNVNNAYATHMLSQTHTYLHEIVWYVWTEHTASFKYLALRARTHIQTSLITKSNDQWTMSSSHASPCVMKEVHWFILHQDKQTKKVHTHTYATLCFDVYYWHIKRLCNSKSEKYCFLSPSLTYFILCFRLLIYSTSVICVPTRWCHPSKTRLSSPCIPFSKKKLWVDALHPHTYRCT